MEVRVMTRVLALDFVSIAISVALSLGLTLATRLMFRSRSEESVGIPA
jgi:hypothetical protein